jgi:flagellar protein FliL
MTAEAETEEVAAPDDDGDAVAKGKRKRLFILIGAGIGVLMALAAGSYFLLFSGGKDAHDPRLASVPQTFIFNLPTMTVNLNGDEDGEAFMKLTIALEVASEDVMTQIQPRMAKVIDAFQVYLRELRKSDIEGSAGIYRLREELKRRINVAIFPAQVDSILFREILVQ